jgi:hypothetical protein
MDGPQPPRVIRPVVPHQTRPGPREIEDRDRLIDEVKGALANVRKTAENWRTGMAGLAALVTATLLFKGRESITDYAGWVGYTLGGLAVASLALAVVSLLLFLAAAYGRVAPVSAQRIIDAGGVDVFNVQLATAALADLRLARRLALASTALLAAALLLSWYGPAAAGNPGAFVQVVVGGDGTHTYCGVLEGLDGRSTVLHVVGEPQSRTIDTSRIVSVRVVKSC